MIVSEIKNKTVGFLKKQYEFFTKVLSGKTLVPFAIKKTLVISLAMIALVLLPIFPFSTLTLAYEVKYDEKSIGFVSEESEYVKAESIVNDKLVGSISQDLELSTAIVPSNSINTANEISKNLTKNLVASDNIVTAYGIYIDDKCIVACTEKSLLLNALESYKSVVEAKTQADIVIFNENVQIKECLSITNNLTDLNATVEILEDAVGCATGYYKTTTKTLKYKTVTKKEKTLYEGITKVKSYGENGKQEVTTLTIYKDGEKISSEVVEKTTVKKAKNQVVLKGAKERPEVDTKGAKYLWPIDKNAYNYVSSNYGPRSGRLHKGIDIIADYGTKILAAEDGIVTRASWFESYGNCVDIRHSDGTVTRYAHCSSIVVSVGDEVVQGQTIAKVGSTGRSTANHLHFEVKPSGGSAVNPYNYVTK